MNFTKFVRTLFFTEHLWTTACSNRWEYFADESKAIKFGHIFPFPLWEPSFRSWISKAFVIHRTTQRRRCRLDDESLISPTKFIAGNKIGQWSSSPRWESSLRHVRSSHLELTVQRVVLKISRISQENTCAGVSLLIKLHWGLQLYWKRDFDTGVFLWILWIFKNPYSFTNLYNSFGSYFWHDKTQPHRHRT